MSDWLDSPTPLDTIPTPMPPKTFGKFVHTLPENQEYLTLNFAPTSAPQRQQRWRNNGLSADFLGEYFAAFFPGNPNGEGQTDLQGEVKASVSYIANELLENAFKYSDDAAHLPISITLRLYDRHIIFQITNYANQTTAQTYQTFLQTLETGDLEDLYSQQLEKTALGEGESCLGILTIIHDYATQGGWQFEPHPENPNLMRVSVMVHLVI
jgi:hypothetical protein